MKERALVTIICIALNITMIFSQNASWLVYPVYDSITPFHEGIAAIEINGKWGYINEQGELIASPEYDVVYDFSNNIGVVTSYDNTITLLIDSKGIKIKPASNLKIDKRFPLFSDGLLLVSNGNKWGYINKSGKVAINPKYYFAKPFSDGLAGVLFDDSGWYYIYPNGQTAIPPVKNEVKVWVSGFNDAKAFIMDINGLSCIDRNGRKTQGNYPSISPPSDYSKNYLPCSEGTIYLDAWNRVSTISLKSGQAYSYLPIQPTNVRNQGVFYFDGYEQVYNSGNIVWNSPSIATIRLSGKTGIIRLSDQPAVEVGLNATILTSVLGEAATLDLTLSNHTSKDLKKLSVRMDDASLRGMEGLKPGTSGQISFEIPKQSTSSIEKKQISISVYEYGLKLIQENLDVQIKDIPSLKVLVPKTTFQIKNGDSFPVGFNVFNKTNTIAKDVLVTIKDGRGSLLFSKTVTILPESTFNGSITLKGKLEGKSAIGNVKQTKRLNIVVKHPKTPSLETEEDITVTITFPHPQSPVDTNTNKEVIINNK
jgi:hypothetical protein